MKATKGKARKPNTKTRQGARIIEGLKEAIAFKRGEKTGATVSVVTARRVSVPAARRYNKAELVGLRKRLGLSQPVFAQALNVSPATVKAWERGAKKPAGAAMRLLEVVHNHPQVVLDRIRSAK